MASVTFQPSSSLSCLFKLYVQFVDNYIYTCLLTKAIMSMWPTHGITTTGVHIIFNNSFDSIHSSFHPSMSAISADTYCRISSWCQKHPQNKRFFFSYFVCLWNSQQDQCVGHLFPSKTLKWNIIYEEKLQPKSLYWETTQKWRERKKTL